MRTPIIVICGPTASGKSALAAAVAEGLGSEVINADSMQVYEELDIGTGKPDREMLRRVAHHAIGHVSIVEPYSAGAFAAAMTPVLDRLCAQGVPPVVCGGSGLYLRALLEGIIPGPPRDPELRAQLQARAALLGVPALHAELAAVDTVTADRVAENDEHRIVRALEVYRLTGMPISAHHARRTSATTRPTARWFGVRRERADIRVRIAARVRTMFAAGLVDELRGLRAAGHTADLQRLRPLGYVEILDALDRGTSEALREAERLTIIHTQQFAKRQATWFRNQHAVEWLDVAADQCATVCVDRIVTTAIPNQAPR